MSDDNMKVAIDLDVRSTGEELVAQLTRQLSKLESQIRSINSTSKSVAQASRPQTPGRNPSTAGSTNAKGEAKAQRQALLFDREQAKAFKTRIASQARAASDALKAEAQAFKNFKTRNEAQSRYESAQVRSLRDRLTAESRIARIRMTAEMSQAREQARSVAAAARAETQRFREAAAAIRENSRIEAREARNIERDRSRHESARGRYVTNLRSGGTDIREGAGRVVRGSAAVSAVGAGAAAYAARKGISSRLEVDSAETNLKIFSGQTNEQIKAARKGFLDNLSIKNGLGIAGGLDAYSEVLKTGMKSPAENVKTIMEAVSALELDLKNTTKLAGLIDRNYGANSDPAKIKSALNAVAVAAREDPTQSNEIIEGVKRAFGALSTGNMTPEQLTALVSGGQSVGIQPGKAGTYVATLGKQLSMGNSKFLGKKNRDELNFAAKELGFGDARNMATQYAKDSYGTMMKFHENLAKMESAKRAQVAEAALGRQWSDEGLQFSQGVGGVKKTYGEITDSKNANFLEEAARQRAESLQGQWNSTKSIFGRFWDSFGQGFEDILSSINRYFLDLYSSFDYDKVKSYVVEFFNGVKNALGVNTWQELLHNLFGGDIGNIGPSIRAFAKGLTEGVMSVGRAIKSFASVFGGGDMSAETIGNLAGKFVASTTALVILGPVLSVLGGLASILTGIAVASKAIAGLAGLATRGAASGAASAGAGAGLLFKGLGLVLSRMFALSVVAEIGANRGVISTWLLDAGKSILNAAVDGLKQAFSRESILSAMKGLVNEVVPAPVQRWLDSDGKLEEKKGLGKRTIEGLPRGIPAAPIAPANPNERGVIGRAWDWLSSSLVGSANASELLPPRKSEAPAPSLDPRPAMEGLKDAIEENTLLLRQSLDKAEGFGGLIHRASFSSTTSANAVKTSMSEPVSGVRQAVLSGSIGSGSYSPGPLEGSTPGSRMGGGGGLGYRGVIGGSGSARGSGPGGLGGGVTPPMLKGQAAANAKTAFDFFKSKGLSTEAASGILASMKQESGFNPQARGDGGRAHGLFQHHPDRRAAIMKATGINMSTAGVEDQLRGAMWEMENGDRGAQRALRILRTPGITAREAGAAFVRHFERPARDERASRGAMAEGFARQFGPGGGSAVPSLANDNATSSQVLQTARNLSVANQQCVSLAKAAVGAGGSVMSWQRGVSAEAGTLKPGTPVATFLDRMGRQSSRYAGGGTGTMGANRDHAGVFQEYIKDAAGKNIGMRLAEQYKGSGGVHSKDYMFGKGSGARNGSNYNVVNGADGQPLGGARNPMNRVAAVAKSPAVEAIKAQVPATPRSTDWNRMGVPTMGVQAPGSDPGRKTPDAGKVQLGRSQRKVDPASGFFDGVKGLFGYGRKASETAQAIKASPIKTKEPTSPLGTEVATPSTKPSLGDNVPPRVSNTAPIGGSGGNGGSAKGGASSSPATINVNGAGMSAEAVANAVQRRLSESMNRRTHDLDPSMI